MTLIRNLVRQHYKKLVNIIPFYEQLTPDHNNDYAKIMLTKKALLVPNTVPCISYGVGFPHVPVKKTMYREV